MNTEMTQRPALILLHGFCGTSEAWSDLAASLSDRFRVLTPDWPGFGDRLHEPPLPTVAAMAQQVLALADAEGLDRFHVLGHSMSGFVVQELLRDHPERVERAVIYGSFAAMQAGGRFESVEDTAARVQREGVAATAQRIVTTWFVDGAAHPRHAECVAQGSRMSMEAALAAMQACAPVDYSGALAHVRRPVLVIAGEHDRTASLSASIALARGIPGAALCVLPQAAHAAHLEQAALFELAVRRFLEGDSNAKRSAGS